MFHLIKIYNRKLILQKEPRKLTNSSSKIYSLEIYGPSGVVSTPEIICKMYMYVTRTCRLPLKKGRESEASFYPSSDHSQLIHLFRFSNKFS